MLVVTLSFRPTRIRRFIFQLHTPDMSLTRGYLVPFMFLTSPALLLVGSWQEIIQSAMSSIVGIFAMSIGGMGYLLSSISLPSRCLFGISGILMIHPATTSDYWGAALLAVGLFVHFYKNRKGRLDIVSDSN